MAINKNFVIKHGAEINTNLLFADADTKRVGIKTAIPQHTLDVRGGIGATDISISGIASIAVGVVTDLSGTNISYSGIGTISTLYSNAGILTTINVSGASTFTDGPVLIGSTILTGTASQRLQVTGGAYVSGNVGLGTTNSGSANIAVVNTTDTASLSIGQNVDGTGENHLGIWYGGTRGTGGANVFTSNGNLRFDVDGAGGSGSQIEFGWGLDPNQTQMVVNSTAVGIGTTLPTSRLTVDGNVRITGVSTLGITTATNLTTQNLNVSGISTLGSSNGIGTVTIGVGTTALYVDGNARIIGNLSVGSGTITLDGINNTINVGSGVTINGNTGIISATAFVIGVTTYVSTLGVTTTTDLTTQQLNVSGVSTLGITSTTNLTTQQINVSGVSTLGITTVTNLTSQQLNVSGVSTLGTVQISSGIVTATTGIVTYYGDGSGLINTPPGNPAGSTGQIQYNSSGSFAGSSNLTFNGSDLYVSGIVSSSALNISGISTFTGGPVLIGGGTSTGTTTTSLQVVGVNSSVYIGGNLGIGTTNPQYKLDVLGDINFTGTFRQNGSQFVASRWTSGTGDDIYRLSGDVGIGTTNPQALLQVGAASSVFVVTDIGSVGIGTTNPTSKLSVVGNVNVSGILSTATLNNVIFGNYSENIFNGGNTGAAATLGLSTSGYFIYTLDQSTTFTFNATGVQAGVFGFAIQLKNGTGGLSIVWPTNVFWPDGGGSGNTNPPSRNTTAGRTDIWSFTTTDQGSTWLGNLAITNYTI